MLLVTRILAFFVIGVPLVLMISYLNLSLNLGISEGDFQIFFMPSLTLLYFFLIFPQLRKGFSKFFIRVKSLDRLIALPILIAIMELIFMYTLVYLPVVFDKEVIAIGKDQYVPHKELSSLGQTFLLGVIGPFNEEVFYRFILLYFLPYSFLYFNFIKNPITIKDNKSKRLTKPFHFFEKIPKWLYYRGFYFQDKKLIGIWIIIVSAFFSFSHGPDVNSFAIYFLPGVLYSYLFLKYGLLSSWIAHGFGNALSPIINQIFIVMLSS
jgi:uncharacterized protein